MGFRRSLMLALLLWSAPAKADWQYTRWGMTPEQVVAAGAGQVRSPTSAEKARILAKSSYDDVLVSEQETDLLRLAVHMYFRRGRLALVELQSLTPHSAMVFTMALLARHGAPIDKMSQFGGETYVWRDTANRNLIVRTYSKDIEYVGAAYHPLDIGAGF